MRLIAIALLLTAGSVSADISRLNWLSGCWAYDGKDAGSGEYWMPPAAGSMFGVSRTVRESNTVGFEYLRIEETMSGSLTLFAAPSGQNAASFELKDSSPGEVIFENNTHDFPQRIIYRLGPQGTLLGRIEGRSDGRDVAIDFPMTAVECGKFGL